MLWCGAGGGAASGRVCGLVSWLRAVQLATTAGSRAGTPLHPII